MKKRRFFTKKIKNQAGISLVEILTSLFIITAISGLFLANYRSNTKRTQLVETTQKIVSDLRLMQNYALGSVEFKGQIPSGGWGAYFRNYTPDQRLFYILFADVDNDGVFDGNENQFLPGDPSDEFFKKVQFPVGIEISQKFLGVKDLSGTLFEKNETRIIFEPPEPTVHIRAPSVTGGISVNVTIEDTVNGEEKVVLANFFGLVDVIK